MEKNIVRLKDIPSNTIEEAIIIFKDNKKAKKIEYTGDFNFINDSTGDNEDYIIKEAELVISDYLQRLDDKQNNFRGKIKKYRILSTSLAVLFLLSIIL